MLSQLYFLSLRGDIILHRTFDHSLPSHSHERFFRHVSLSNPSPIFNISGINFAFLKTKGLYLVGATRKDSPPSLLIRTLEKLFSILENFLGSPDEISVRKNVYMVYQVVDQFIDRGITQNIAYEQIEKAVINCPKMESALGQSVVKGLSALGIRYQSSTLIDSLYIQVVERMHNVYDSNSYLLRCFIDGQISARNLLKNCRLFYVELDTSLSQLASKAIQNFSLGEGVELQTLGSLKQLKVQTGPNSTSLLNYRCCQYINSPFTLHHFIQWVSSFKMELVIKLRSCLSTSTTKNIRVEFNLPSDTSSANYQINAAASAGQHVELNIKKGNCLWSVPQLVGDSQLTFSCKITLNSQNLNILKAKSEIGPIMLSFDTKDMILSGLRVRTVRGCGEGSSYFVNYLLKADSCQYRV